MVNFDLYKFRSNSTKFHQIRAKFTKFYEILPITRSNVPKADQNMKNTKTSKRCISNAPKAAYFSKNHVLELRKIYTEKDKIASKHEDTMITDNFRIEMRKFWRKKRTKKRFSTGPIWSTFCHRNRTKLAVFNKIKIAPKYAKLRH